MSTTEQTTTSVHEVTFDGKGVVVCESVPLAFAPLKPAPVHCPHCAREINVAIPAPGVCKHVEKQST